MFDSAVTIDPQNFVVMAFYNDAWTEITPTSFDASAKTITINHSFPEESFLFFKTTQVLSIKEIEKNSTNILLYPNPTSSNVTITLKDNEVIKKIEFYNIMGQLVLSKRLQNSSETSINISKLSKGMYIVKTFGENNTCSKKLMIQ